MNTSDTSTNTVRTRGAAAQDLEPLRTALHGRLVQPHDEDWDAVSLPWNLAIRHQPRAVVEAADAHDVAQTVRYAAKEGLKVAPQAGGHGATRALDDTIIVRTAALDDIWIDSHARVARVDAGVRWGALQSALDGTGLTGLTGSNPDVSVVGYCTAGGLSWFTREYGTGAGSLRAAEIVDSTGERRWVDDARDPDLMWALRGGGGNFVFVTAVEIDLFPAPEIAGGRLMFPASESRDVLGAFADACATVPTHVSLWASVAHFPDVPFLPEPIRGQSFCMIDAVTSERPETLASVLEPIRAAGHVIDDTVRRLEPGQVGEVCQEPVDPSAALVKVVPLGRFDREVIEALMPHCAEPSAVFQVQIRHLSGRQGIGHPGIAAGDPGAEFIVAGVSILPFPELEVPAREQLAALKQTLMPWSEGNVLPTLLSDDDSLERAFGYSDLKRLREVKRRVDPNAILRGNYPL